MKKAQAATEYLIILAVVIIIALIVIGVMGGIPGLGSSGKIRASQVYWGSLRLSLDEYSIDELGAYTFIFKNTGKETYYLKRIKIEKDTTGTVLAEFPSSGLPNMTGVLPPGSILKVRYNGSPMPGVCGAILPQCQINPAAERCGRGKLYSYRFEFIFEDDRGSIFIEKGGDTPALLYGICAQRA